MDKALKALKALRLDISDHSLLFSNEKLDIIEAALKRNIKLENEHNALKIIKRCPSEIIEILYTYFSWEEYREDYYNREKRKGLIKNRQEFDLLKKVLV